MRQSQNIKLDEVKLGAMTVFRFNQTLFINRLLQTNDSGRKELLQQGKTLCGTRLTWVDPAVDLVPIKGGGGEGGGQGGNRKKKRTDSCSINGDSKSE